MAPSSNGMSESQVEAHMRGLEARIDGLAVEMKDLHELEQAARAAVLSSNGARPSWSEVPSKRLDTIERLLHRIDQRRDAL